MNPGFPKDLKNRDLSVQKIKEAAMQNSMNICVAAFWFFSSAESGFPVNPE